MHRFFLLSPALFLLLSSPLRAQTPAATGSVKVTVNDRKAGQPLEFAAVTLVAAKDSSFKSGTLTAKNGSAVISAVAPGAYLLKISFIGYKSEWRPVKVASQQVDAGTVTLDEGVLLNDVAIKGEAVAIQVKKDTTEFNTSSFKAPPDASLESGLRNLPGIVVDQSGGIKANGETVTKVLVEGKPFFGDDPKIATKNLQYDDVKKVQVIDDKSDLAKATGIDDGKRSKVINILLKDDRKRGWFGSGSMAGGTASRYLGSTSVNRFSEKKQLNGLLLSNNINQTGFSSDEARNFGGGASVGGLNEGLTKTHSGGLNYSNEWGTRKKGLTLSTNYFGSRQSTYYESESYIEQTQPGGGLYFNEEIGVGTRTSTQHRVGGRINWNLDSLTSIAVQSNNPLTLNENRSTAGFSQADAARSPLNDGTRASENHSAKIQTSGDLTATRKFRANRGSVSWNTYWLVSPTDADNITRSENKFYQSVRPDISINRLESRDLASNVLNSTLTLTRAVGKSGKAWLILAPFVKLSRNQADQNTLEYNPLNGFYENRLDSLTNMSRNSNSTAGIGLGFNKSFKKGNIYLQPSVSSMTLDGDIRNEGYFERVSKTFVGILPVLSGAYDFSKSKRLSINISGNNSLPSVGDLLVRQNNTNPLSIREGNPDLKLSSSVTSTLRYSTSNTARRRYTSIYLNYSQTMNAMSRNSWFDETTGISTSKPVNVNGNYSAYMSVSFAVPTKVAGLNISPSLGISQGRNRNFVNGNPNRSNRVGVDINGNISYSYKEALLISLYQRTSYSTIHNTIASTLANTIWSIDNIVNANGSPVKNWRIQSTVSHRAYGGQQVVTLSASLQHSLMQKNRLLLEFSGFDLLNRNREFYRYASENQVIESRSNALGQYFYLKATYKVNKTDGQKK